VTQPQPEKKVFTHNIQIPPNTNLEELGGAYKALLEAVGVKASLIPFEANPQGFTHPIEECNKILTRDYMATMQLLQSSVLHHGAVYLENLTFHANSAVFVFFYME
jgi:hypothetical protein